MNVLKSCRHGLMLFNTNDAFVGKSLQEYGEFSQGEVDLFEVLVQPDMTVLDIGANIGCHTLAFAKLVGPHGLVFAYEPQRLSYYSLCANVALNNLTNVFCLQNAVGRANGRIDVPELDYSRPNNFGGVDLNMQYEGCNKTSIKMTRLDDLSLERVDFIKADVEGMEADVLLGGKELIKKHRPFLYIENDRSEGVSLLVKIVRSLDYEIYFHAPSLFNPKNFLRNYRNEFGNLASINMLCLPKERPVKLDEEKLLLIAVNCNGKVTLKTDTESKERIHESITDAVISSCIKAAIYYSERLHEHERALAFTEMVVRVNPDKWEGYYHAAMILCRKCDYPLALPFLDKAIKIRPDDFKTIINRATVLGGLGRYTDAIEEYDKAIVIQPEAANAHFYKGCCLLALGRAEEGWAESEWRFKLSKVLQFTRLLPQFPMWDGSSLVGKRILLFCEQGAGDTIQFVRYVKHIKNLGAAHVALTCGSPLVKLIESCEGVDEIIPFNSDDATVLEGNYDFLCSIISLPKFFGIDTSQKYLHTSGESSYDIDNKYLNVGICWAGSELHDNDYARSCYLNYFTALQHPSIRLYSLQKDCGKRVWQTEGAVDLLKDSSAVNLIDHTSSFIDFNETAKLIQKLDLVITVDTSISHLAGSLGVPTWLLLGFYSDPRWGLNITTTPWYPSVKIFRQPNYSRNWPHVFEEVRKSLLEFNKKRS